MRACTNASPHSENRSRQRSNARRSPAGKASTNRCSLSLTEIGFHGCSPRLRQLPQEVVDSTGSPHLPPGFGTMPPTGPALVRSTVPALDPTGATPVSSRGHVQRRWIRAMRSRRLRPDRRRLRRGVLRSGDHRKRKHRRSARHREHDAGYRDFSDMPCESATMKTFSAPGQIAHHPVHRDANSAVRRRYASVRWRASFIRTRTPGVSPAWLRACGSAPVSRSAIRIVIHADTSSGVSRCLVDTTRAVAESLVRAAETSGRACGFETSAARWRLAGLDRGMTG